MTDHRPTSAGNTDFDDWKDSYTDALERAIPFLPQSHDFYARTKALELVAIAERRLGPARTLHALDVGCGIGLIHPHLVPQLGRLEGADIAEGSIAHAQAHNPEVQYHSYDGEHLPHGEHSVDLAFAMGVVHHVPPLQWRAFLSELVRVTRVGGLVALVEPNLLNPVCRWGASRCEFDHDATFLRAARLRRLAEAAGLRDVQTDYILFLPFEMPGRQRLERRLRRLPIGAQYILSGRVT